MVNANSSRKFVDSVAVKHSISLLKFIIFVHFCWPKPFFSLLFFQVGWYFNIPPKILWAGNFKSIDKSQQVIIGSHNFQLNWPFKKQYFLFLYHLKRFFSQIIWINCHRTFLLNWFGVYKVRITWEIKKYIVSEFCVYENYPMSSSVFLSRSQKFDEMP